MDGNIVKAAWILGGSVVAGGVMAGVGAGLGALYLTNTFVHTLDATSKRAAEAVMAAPANTRVAFRADDGGMIKVGFEPKLPIAMRVENSMDDNRGKRAVFEVEVKPTLNK